jgi:hypothetical protein
MPRPGKPTPPDTPTEQGLPPTIEGAITSGVFRIVVVDVVLVPELTGVAVSAPPDEEVGVVVVTVTLETPPLPPAPPCDLDVEDPVFEVELPDVAVDAPVDEVEFDAPVVAFALPPVADELVPIADAPDVDLVVLVKDEFAPEFEMPLPTLEPLARFVLVSVGLALALLLVSELLTAFELEPDVVV